MAFFSLNRNFGCRIKEYSIYGMKTVSLENDIISVVVLADKGTDIIEFVYKPLDIDFMWHSFNSLKNCAKHIASCEPEGGPFLDHYEGGWQELFPTYGAKCDYYGASIGVHGEVWNLAWEYSIVADTPEIISVKFWARTIRSPFYIEKTLTIKLHDPSLYIDEHIINEGGSHLDFMWGHHPAFGPLFIDDSCHIEISGNTTIIPDSTGMLAAKQSQWPFAFDKQGNRIDLSKMRHPGCGLNLSCVLEGCDPGLYRITNTDIGLGFGLEWDNKVFPFIRIWEPNCTQSHAPWFNRDYVLAVEPWTSPLEDFSELSKRGGGAPISPGEMISTSLRAYAFRMEA